MELTFAGGLQVGHHHSSPPGASTFFCPQRFANRSTQSLLVLLTLATTSCLLFDLWPIALPLPLRTSREIPPPSLAWKWRALLNSCMAYAFLETFWYGLMTGVSDVPIWWLLMACFVHLIAVGGFAKAVVEILGSGGEEKEGGERFRDEGDVEGETEKDVGAKLVAVQKEEEGNTSMSPFLESNSEHSKSPRPPRIPWQFRLLPLLPQTTTAAINAALLFYARSRSLPTSATWRDSSPVGWCILAILSLFIVLCAKSCNLFILSLRSKAPRNSSDETATAFWLRRLTNWMFLFLARAGMRWVAGQDVFSFPSVDEHGNLQIASSLSDAGTREAWPDRKAFDRAMGRIPTWVGHVATVLNLCFVGGLWFKQRRERRRREREEALNREREG